MTLVTAPAGRDSRRLEEVDPPVCRAQVEHVGPLAIVGRLHSQRVVDGDGVLQVLLGELLVGPVLTLMRHTSFDFPQQRETCLIQRGGEGEKNIGFNGSDVKTERAAFLIKHDMI